MDPYLGPCGKMRAGVGGRAAERLAHRPHKSLGKLRALRAELGASTSPPARAAENKAIPGQKWDSGRPEPRNRTRQTRRLISRHRPHGGPQRSCTMLQASATQRTAPDAVAHRAGPGGSATLGAAPDAVLHRAGTGLRGRGLLAAAVAAIAACLSAATAANGFLLECNSPDQMLNTYSVPSTSMRGLCKPPAYQEYVASLNGTGGSATMPQERDIPPSYNWGFELFDYWEVPETAGQSGAYHVFPDSHVPAVPHPNGGWVLFWANSENWRSRGFGPGPDQQQYYEPFGMMYGGRTWRWGYDNGGKWLMSVSPHPTDGNPWHLVGFYHAEDGFW
ncbi:hypothetical protein DFJ74DRAFT_390524 [Hyaloraphidium curvatum]|nr:hypothetical protein DFJ74DRAFT_390524 [Hyaloraphidium curvatum]